MNEPLLIAVDSGTSVVKAVAFTAGGSFVADAARPNRIEPGPGGAVEQDMARTWDDCRHVLAALAERLDGASVAALAVTAQGDGTWLVDRDGAPVAPALIWLDARARDVVAELRSGGEARAAFAFTGTGLNACQQSAQLLWLARNRPKVLARAATALHCKDWLYLNLTGIRASDPSEACMTFGDYRTRGYRREVLEALGMTTMERLLPPIVEGTRQWHPLTPAAAARTGLKPGLPVVLGAIDTVCTGLGAGLYGGGEAGVSILGSTAMHLRLVADPDHVAPSPDMTGYCKPFPVPRHTMQAETSMAATLNMDWLADLVRDAARLAGGAPPGRLIETGRIETGRIEILRAIDAAVGGARPGAIVYHPFISTSGERGPFVDACARAALLGIDQNVRLADLARGVYEGLGFSSRDCYRAMGGVPPAVRVTGGAARSKVMRKILAACLDRPVSGAAHAEAGAAGAAMMAAVGTGLYPDMAACAARWIGAAAPPAEMPDRDLAAIYDGLFPIYRASYAVMPPFWHRLHGARARSDVR
ncbi:MAG: FGGY family carbohydrate kinase [Acetobacteraceae bacterium]